MDMSVFSLTKLQNINWRAHFKRQRSNYLLSICIFCFATIMNTYNSLAERQRLLDMHFSELETHIRHDILFMNRIDRVITNKTIHNISKLRDTIRRRSYTAQELIQLASAWEAIFTVALTQTDIKVLNDYESLRKAHASLISSLLRYNLAAQRYNAYASKTRVKLLHINQDLALYTSIPISAPTDNFEIVSR